MENKKRTYTFTCSVCKKPYQTEIEGYLEKKLWMKIVRDGACAPCATKIMGEGNGNSENGY